MFHRKRLLYCSKRLIWIPIWVLIWVVLIYFFCLKLTFLILQFLRIFKIIYFSFRNLIVSRAFGGAINLFWQYRVKVLLIIFVIWFLAIALIFVIILFLWIYFLVWLLTWINVLLWNFNVWDILLIFLRALRNDRIGWQFILTLIDLNSKKKLVLRFYLWRIFVICFYLLTLRIWYTRLGFDFILLGDNRVKVSWVIWAFIWFLWLFL